MTARIVFLMTFLCAGGAESSAASQAVQAKAAAGRYSSHPEVKGVVVDERDRPVSGAQIRFVDVIDARPPVRSKRDGSFRINAPRPSVRNDVLIAESPTGKLQGIFRFENNRRAAEAVRIRLKPAHEISVQVVDVDGKPVSGAQVEVFESHSITGFREGQTDAAGRAQLKVPADARIVWVTAFKPKTGFDYYENYRSSPARFHQRPPSSVRLVLRGARSARLHIVDSAGKPIQGVRVAPVEIKLSGKLGRCNLSGSRTATLPTDVEGRVRFDWLPGVFERSIDFSVYHPDYVCESYPFLPAVGGPPSVEITLQRKGTLSGRVLKPNGEPAPGILLRTAPSALGRTDSKGAFRIKVRPERKGLLSVVDDKRAASAPVLFELKEGEVRKDLEIELVRGTVIRGRVSVMADSGPAGGLHVSLAEHHPEADVPLYRSTETDSGGRYRFRVGPGHYRLKVAFGGMREPVSLEIDDQKEVVVGASLVQRPWRRFTGRVVDDRGNPVAARIFTAAVGMTDMQAITDDDDDGNFSIRRWGQEMFVYAVSIDGTRAGWTICPPDENTTTITVAPAASVSGRVVDSHGRPLANALVGCAVFASETLRLGVRQTVVTGNDGSFEIGGLAVGRVCRLGASWGRESVSAGEFTVEAADEIPIADMVIPRAGR